MKKIILAFTAAILFSSISSAQNMSYDISGASGSRDGESYSEIHLGLNYWVNDWFNWRNSVFTQFGSNIDSVFGLDTAGLFNYALYTQSRQIGLELFAGPGLRFATENSNAAFGKAGVTFALAGLRLGVGVQAFHYFEDRTDKQGRTFNKDETQLFFTISGGGSL